MRYLAMILALLTLLHCGGGLSRDSLESEVQVTQKKLQDIELQYGHLPSAKELIHNMQAQLKDVDDLLLEGEFKKVESLLEEVNANLEVYVSKQGAPGDRQLQVYGKVTYKAMGGTEFQKLMGTEDIGTIETIRTSIRSAVNLKIPGDGFIILAPQSEITFKSYDLSTGTVHIDLIQGVFTLNSTATLKFKLSKADFMVEADEPISCEFSRQTITGNEYFAVFAGAAKWTQAEMQGNIFKRQGLRWLDGKPIEHDLPPTPSMESPSNNEVIYTGQETAIVPFRWSTTSMIPNYQMQVSTQDDFVTRVFDRINLSKRSADTELALGVYYWRVRGFSDEDMPGDWSKVYTLYVREGQSVKGTENAEIENFEVRKEGPPIDEVNFEIIGDTVIVSGKTDPNARISVNDVTGVVMDAGKFRAVIRVFDRGTVTIVITGTWDDSDASTIIEKKVYIRN